MCINYQSSYLTSPRRWDNRHEQPYLEAFRNVLLNKEKREKSLLLLQIVLRGLVLPWISCSLGQYQTFLEPETELELPTLLSPHALP